MMSQQLDFERSEFVHDAQIYDTNVQNTPMILQPLDSNVRNTPIL